MDQWLQDASATGDAALISEGIAITGASLDGLILNAIDVLPYTSVMVFDRDLRYRLVRGAAVADNGLDRADFEGRRAPEALAPERWAIYRPMYEAALRGESATLSVESPDGKRHYMIRIAPVHGAAGEVLGGVLVGTDVTDRRHAEEALASSERAFRLTFESAPIGMAIVSIDRQFKDVNRALCGMLRQTREWLLDHRIPDVLDSGDDALDLSIRAEVLAGSVTSATSEKRLIRSDGHLLWVQHSVGLLRDAHGVPSQYVSQFVDITEAHNASEEMRYLATHDVLTRLANRSHFVDRMEAVLAHPARAGLRIGLFYLDVDRFKGINDSYGHAVGDQVLRALAERIISQVRADDIVSRFGGDEFVVALTAIHGADDALAVADKLQRAAQEPIFYDRHEVQASVSIGIALTDTGGDVDDALRRADHALYGAKAAGGARTVISPD